MSDKKPALSADTQALVDALQIIFSNRDSLAKRHEEALREMQDLTLPIAPPEKVPHRVPCIHPTGYRFTAVVAPSDKYQGGRWVSIEDEQWPTDDEMCVSTHPIFCDGSGNWWGRRRRFRNGTEYDKDTQIWLYLNVRLPILRLVGSELPVDYRLDMQAKVKAIRDAADEALRDVQGKLTALAATVQAPSPPPPEAIDASLTPKPIAESPKKKSA